MDWSWFTFFSEFRPEVLVATIVLGIIYEAASIMWRRVKNVVIGGLATEIGSTLVIMVLIFAALVGIRFAVSDPKGRGFDGSYIYNVSVPNPKKPEPSTGRPPIIIEVMFKNTGAPSALDAFEVTFNTSDGQPATGEIISTVGVIRQDGSRLPLSTTFTQGRSPIFNPGAINPAIFIVDFKALNPEETRRSGSTITLSFKDVFGRKYKVSKKSTGKLFNPEGHS